MVFSEERVRYIVGVAREAGDMALRYFRDGNFTVSRKIDDSEVTCADVALSKFIARQLSEYFPDIAVICEEGDLRDHDLDMFFLVDPIDGTGSFAALKEDFSINIAVVKDKKVVFGLIYAPLFEGGKMMYSNCHNQLVLEVSGVEKVISRVEQNECFNIVTSKRTKEEQLCFYMRKFYPDIANYEIKRVSSAAKFFPLIEGKVSLYLHFRPSMEWDIAAGHYLVELIGGEVKKLKITKDNISLDGAFFYNKPNYLNGPFMAKIT